MTKPFRAFHALQQAYSAVFGAADRQLKKQEDILTAHQVVLFILCNEDGLPSSEIASRAGMSKSRLTGLIDGLESKSLLRRQRGEQDARQQLLFIESSGRALIERTKGWVNDLNARLLDNFDQSERQVIQRFLDNAVSLGHQSTSEE